MSRKEVLVTVPTQETHQMKFRECAPEYRFHFVTPEKVTKEDVKKVSAIVGNIKPAVLKYADQLEWMQLNSAGADQYIGEDITKNNVIITNASGAYGLAISEHMLGGILMLGKNLHLYRDNMKRHTWKDEGAADSIWGSKTLIIGLGDIGCEFAKRMHMLGSEVYGIRRNLKESPSYIKAMYKMEELDELIPRMDYVALTLPKQKELYHYFDKSFFGKMKKTAIFLNVGRGELVDTEALCEALNAGIIKGAVVDVTDPEPLPNEHPMWECENLILTPHVSGGYHLKETLERIIEISLENMRRFYQGDILLNQVERETGYRKVENRAE